MYVYEVILNISRKYIYMYIYITSLAEWLSVLMLKTVFL